MIRIVRTVEAKPGKRSQVIDVWNEISQYAATQDVAIRVFTEPWGHSSLVHIHTDYEDADAALGLFEKIVNNPRGEEAVQRLYALIEGHIESSFYLEE